MKLLRPGLLSAIVVILIIFLAPGLAQQSADDQSLFTISVATPSKAKDVQVRYYFTGEFGGYAASTASPTDDNKIVIKTSMQGKPAKSFKLIAYAPGCQFVTISVDDLGSSDRQGAFQCTPLNTVQFYGRANVSAIAQKALQVGVLYGCDWAGDFFGMSGAVSPFTVGKALIDSDGSFTVSLPDFSGDPLWTSLSNNATLLFIASDSSNGQPLAALRAANAGSKAGGVKVAPSYPEVEFTLQAPTPLPLALPN